MQPEGQRVLCVGYSAISIGLGRAVDVAELCGAERFNGHRDVFRRTDGEPGPHRTQAAPGVILMLQQSPRHIAHAVVDAAAFALDQRQCLAGLEDLLQYDTAAMSQDCRQGMAEPNDQKSGTASHSRSVARRCWRSPISKPLAMSGPCARVTPLGAAVDPEV